MTDGAFDIIGKTGPVIIRKRKFAKNYTKPKGTNSEFEVVGYKSRDTTE